MPHIHIEDGILTTERFGDRVAIRLPEGGHVEIRTDVGHTDVEVRGRTGAVERRFRLPKEGA
jgi:hypothetical protein